MNVIILDSSDWDKLPLGITKQEIKSLIEALTTEVCKILPNVSNMLNIIVKPGLPHVASEMGVGGSAYDTELLDITFDTTMPLGIEKFKQYLRDTVFHEMNHCVRYGFEPMNDEIELNWVISEGLAVVFERDYAGAQHTWKKYTDDTTMQQWYERYKNSNEAGFNKPDGWIEWAYKTGSWLVDRAIKHSDMSVIELTKLPTNEIIKLAEVD